MINWELNTLYNINFNISGFESDYLLTLNIIYGNKIDWINTINADENNIYLIKCNEYGIEVDIETMSFINNNLSCEIFDGNEELINILRNENIKEEENVFIELKTNGMLVFKGYLNKLGITYDKKEKRLIIDFKPIIYKLKEIKALNNGQIWEDIYSEQVPVLLTEIIKRIYKKVDNGSNEINISDNIILKCINENYNPPIVGNVNIKDIYVDEGIFKNNQGFYNDINLADSIKRIAVSLGCITGLNEKGEIIFKRYNADDVININENDLIDLKIEGRRNKVKAIEIADYNGNSYTIGNTDVTDNFKLQKTISDLYLGYIDNELANAINIFIEDENIIYTFVEYVAKELQKIYMTTKYTEDVKITVKGINYEIGKNIKINDMEIRPVKIVKRFTEGWSEITGIEV